MCNGDGGNPWNSTIKIIVDGPLLRLSVFSVSSFGGAAECPEKPNGFSDDYPYISLLNGYFIGGIAHFQTEID